MEWVDGSDVLGRAYGLRDYAEHTQGLPVEAMVYVEVAVAPHYTLLETDWVIACATQDSRLRAIVAHAPLEYGDQVRSYLDALTSRGPLIKGVRRLLQGEADPGFCLQPRFVTGVQLLAEYGLSFDVCILHHQLPAVIDLARRCPETQMVLDHLGKPAIKARQIEPWREHIAELARLPNVFCKVSGAVTEADHARWTRDDLAPYVRHVLEAFGDDRVMFGGDWPVVLLASSYQRWVQTLDDLTRDVPERARRKLWADNATRFYRLD
jgi:L-fuconolactonase